MAPESRRAGGGMVATGPKHAAVERKGPMAEAMHVQRRGSRAISRPGRPLGRYVFRSSGSGSSPRGVLLEPYDPWLEIW